MKINGNAADHSFDLTAKTSPKDLLKLFQELTRIDTGRSFLDSGDYYGRKYDAAVRANPIDITEDPSDLSISTAHHCAQCLEMDSFSVSLDRGFRNWSELPENEDKNWLKAGSCFLDMLEDRGRISFNGYLNGREFANSYNWETELDQVIQFCIFSDAAEDSNYIAIQFHTGCDVRGGYTRPFFFRINDHATEYFLDMRISIYIDTENDSEDLTVYDLEDQVNDGRISFNPEDQEFYRTEDQARVSMHCTAEGF